MISFRELFEQEEIDEQRIKRVNRIRGGKVQRRKKVAGAGYKMQDGKAVRMKASERLKRRRGAVKSARKRRGKKSQMNRKRAISMRKRQSRGM